VDEFKEMLGLLKVPEVAEENLGVFCPCKSRAQFFFFLFFGDFFFIEFVGDSCGGGARAGWGKTLVLAVL